jgi:hypothetical protein
MCLLTLATAAVPPAWARVDTPGEFAASESGAATYNIAIQVPRGIGGMEPSLSLSYSSQGGNGVLGIGWLLGGVTAVTRCARSWATDRYRGAVTFTDHPAVNADRYCLDGQRLVLTDSIGARRLDQASYGVGGTEYRTERESFARVRLVRAAGSGAPDGFRVWTKSGQVMDYGLICNGPTSAASCSVAENSRMPTNGGVVTTNRWMIERVWDRNGSFVEFTYCKGKVITDGSGNASCDGQFKGSAGLFHVRYTSRSGTPGTNAVLIRYEDREDKVPSFHAGSRSVQEQRVSGIETYINWQGPGNRGTLVRRYALTYETLDGRATNVSRLRRVQEFDASGNALLPLEFAWARDAVFGQAVQHSASAPALPPRPPLEGCGGTTGRTTGVICP